MQRFEGLDFRWGHVALLAARLGIRLARLAAMGKTLDTPTGDQAQLVEHDAFERATACLIDPGVESGDELPRKTKFNFSLGCHDQPRPVGLLLLVESQTWNL
ncbi:hypothetical protein D3C76_1716730 [compost metagenome]